MNPSPDALDRLEKVCQPATFGLNDKDVLDESYRKAGKLDIDSFMLGFDAERTGLLDAVRMALFPGREETRSIDAELYKLNIYGECLLIVDSDFFVPSRAYNSDMNNDTDRPRRSGKDAFFKPHKDTPRAPHMFGSLVIVFPTPHTGGALNLRYEDKEYTFDASQLLTKAELVPSSRTDNEPKDVQSPHVAFVAFFSDVEHEVMPVTSGHRITITYNLYFAMGTPAAYLRARTHAIQLAQPRTLHADSIADAVHALVNDSSCLGSGGVLGFGLRHQYPLPQSWTLGDPNPLRQLEDFLKGTDAALFRALEGEGLLPVLRLYYDEDNSGESGVLLDRVVYVQLPGSEDDLYTQTMTGGGITVQVIRSIEAKLWNGVVHMVTPMTGWNRVKAGYMAYGNQTTLGLAYADLCLVVDMPARGRLGFLEENGRAGSFFGNAEDEHEQSELTGPF